MARDQEALTASISNLHTGLSDVDGDDFTHSIAYYINMRWTGKSKHSKSPYLRWRERGGVMGEGLKFGRQTKVSIETAPNELPR